MSDVAKVTGRRESVTSANLAPLSTRHLAASSVVAKVDLVMASASSRLTNSIGFAPRDISGVKRAAFFGLAGIPAIAISCETAELASLAIAVSGRLLSTTKRSVVERSDMASSTRSCP